VQHHEEPYQFFCFSVSYSCPSLFSCLHASRYDILIDLLQYYYYYLICTYIYQVISSPQLPTKTCMQLSSCPTACYMSCSYNFLDLISIIIFGAKYKLCCPEILGSFQSAVGSFNLVSHILTVCSQNKAGLKFSFIEQSW